MASYNVQMNMLNESGTYDIIWPEMNCRHLEDNDYILTNVECYEYGNSSVTIPIKLDNIYTKMNLLNYSNGISRLNIKFEIDDSNSVSISSQKIYVLNVKNIINFLGSNKVCLAPYYDFSGFVDSDIFPIRCDYLAMSTGQLILFFKPLQNGLIRPSANCIMIKWE